MTMSENEKQKIVQYAEFLEYKGYTSSIKNSMITYSNDKIDIIITYEPNSDVSDINIKFVNENEIYSVGWIACVRNGLKISPHQRLENVIRLLSYLKDNYSTIIDIAYCKESNKLVDQFIANERKKKKQ